MAWLTDASIKTVVESWGVTISAGAESGIAALVQGQVEQIIGYPLVKSATNESHRFSAPTPARTVAVLFPEPWANVESVSVGVTYDSLGTELVEDRDYRLIVHVMPDRTMVYRGVRFLSAVSSAPDSIEITGKPGVWAENAVPAEILQAAKEMGAAYLQAMGASTSDASDITETQTGQVKIKFGRATGFATWGGLTARGKAAVDRAKMVLSRYQIGGVYA